MPQRLPPPWLLAGKNIQFSILVLLEAQETNFRGTLKVNMMKLVSNKSTTPLTCELFFEIFIHHPHLTSLTPGQSSVECLKVLVIQLIVYNN